MDEQIIVIINEQEVAGQVEDVEISCWGGT